MIPTAKKGRPTPKAPQNRPKPPAEPRELTSAEKVARERLRQRRAARRKVAAYRVAFSGVLPYRQARLLHPTIAQRRSFGLVEAGRIDREEREGLAA